MDLDRVRAAEHELLTESTRRDPARMRELLHPDFIEIGRSGRRWTRDEIIAELAHEDDREPTVTEQWDFVELSPELALVAYVIRTPTRSSRHSSIWGIEQDRLQLRFHQGTFVGEA